MRLLQAHTHLSLGKLYRRADRPHEARAELNVAIDLYPSMEMRPIGCRRPKPGWLPSRSSTPGCGRKPCAPTGPG